MLHSNPEGPAIYTGLRDQALQLRSPNLPAGAIHAVLLDWPVEDGCVTILAAADGTASLYLSGGGAFLGGSQARPEIRVAALYAVQLASTLLHHLHPVQWTPVPPPGIATLYITLSELVLSVSSAEIFFANGSHPAAPLAAAMQRIITEYRIWDQSRSS